MANVFQNVLNYIRGGGSRTINQEVKLNYIPYGGFPVYPDSNISQFIKFYETNADVYSVVTLIAKKFASIPTYFYKVEDEKAQASLKMARKAAPMYQWKKFQKKAYNEEAEDNYITQLINNPNPEQSKELFDMLACLYLLITGESFIWLNRGYEFDELEEMSDEDIATFPVKEMQILPSQFVEIIRGDDWWSPGYYRLQVNGRFFPIRKPDVIHWKMPNLQFDGITLPQLRGQSPLKAGLKTVTASDSLTDAQVAMAQNDGAKGVLFNEINVNPSPDQANKIKETIDNRINSKDVKGAVATLQGKWGYLDMSQTGKEMELTDAKKAYLASICNLYGISPNLFMQGTSFENLSQSRKDLITNCIMLLKDNYNGELKRGIEKSVKYNYKWTIDSDYTCLPEMQEDMKAQVEALSQAWWFSPNQRLEQMNEERSDDPNMDRIYIPTTLTPLDDLNVIVDDYSNPLGADQGNPASVTARI